MDWRITSRDDFVEVQADDEDATAQANVGPDGLPTSLPPGLVSIWPSSLPTWPQRGIFGTTRRNSATLPRLGNNASTRRSISRGRVRRLMARVLPCSVVSNNVFRATLLSVVLTLATGANAALYCGVWCHSGERMAGACELQTQATPGIVANDDCAVSGNPVVFVREDGRRSATAPDVAGAVAVSRFAFTPSAAGTLSPYEPNSRLLLELRPLVYALRI